MEYKRTIGVLGGMGPAATADFLTKLVRFTQAEKDQDHPRIIVDCNPKIPDRTSAILSGGADPLPAMVRGLKYLESAGVDYIVIPCVTAHYFHPKLQACTSTPILHIVRETVAHISVQYPQVKKLGVIATSGTIKSGLISDICGEAGIECIAPEESIQATQVMEAIYQIKASGPSMDLMKLVHAAANIMVGEGAQAVIAGCTEIPLVLTDGDLTVPVLDPVAILAKQVLSRAAEPRNVQSFAAKTCVTPPAIYS